MSIYRTIALMEIKGFSQSIAANKQQWCGLVAAASCGIVAACEFFVCKLVLLLFNSCSNLSALSCCNLAAPCCSNLAALSVQRVCRPSYAPNFEKVDGAYCFWSVR